MTVRDLWTKAKDGSPTERYGKGNRWQATWTDDAGKRQSRTFSKKVDASRFENSTKTDVERNVFVDPKSGKVSLRKYAADWLNLQTVRATTVESYARYLDNYILPTLGGSDLGSLRASDIKAWLKDLQGRTTTAAAVDEDTPGEVRTLSRNTVGQALRILRMVLSSAVDDRLIPSNPATARSVKLKNRSDKPSTKPDGVQVWSVSEADRVASELPERWQVVVKLGIQSGLRPGELFGLCVDDINFLGRELTVRRQVINVRSRLCFGPPKTEDSFRTIPITDDLVTALAHHLERFPPVQVTLPYAEPDGEPVTVRPLFTTRERGAVNKNYFSSNIWRPALKRAGMPVTRANGMHVLRHSYASLMLAHGIGVAEVAKYLGHHDPGFTLRTYAHLIPTSDNRSRAAIAAALRAAIQESNRTETEQTL